MRNVTKDLDVALGKLQSTRSIINTVNTDLHGWDDRSSVRARELSDIALTIRDAEELLKQLLNDMTPK